MPELRELLTGLGYEDVVTLVQSGNVVLGSSVAPAELERDLQREIAERFGVDTPVVARSRQQLAKVVAGNPFPDAADDPKRYQVSFLAAKCPTAAARELEAADVAPERVAVRGREVYTWHVNGIQHSPLAKLLTERKLGVTSTARNWNTVLKLHELADG